MKNYKGLKFNKLTAIQFTGKYHSGKNNRSKKAIWLFKCECGTTKELIIDNVTRKTDATKSCGCLLSTRTPEESMLHLVWYDSVYKDGDLSEQDFAELSQQNCFYCDCPPSNTRLHRTNKSISFTYNGLDRIDNNLPHYRDNVVPACFPCNEIKSNYTLPEFLYKISKIYHHRIANYEIK